MGCEQPLFGMFGLEEQEGTFLVQKNIRKLALSPPVLWCVLNNGYNCATVFCILGFQKAFKKGEDIYWVFQVYLGPHAVLHDPKSKVNFS